MSDLLMPFNCDPQIEKQIDKLINLFNIECAYVGEKTPLYITQPTT